MQEINDYQKNYVIGGMVGCLTDAEVSGIFTLMAMVGASVFTGMNRYGYFRNIRNSLLAIGMSRGFAAFIIICSKK